MKDETEVHPSLVQIQAWTDHNTVMETVMKRAAGGVPIEKAELPAENDS